MKYPIYAVCFDVGGTLRNTQKNENTRKAGISKIHAMLNYDGSIDELDQLIRQGQKAYRHWCTRSLYELNEEDLWSEYFLPEFPKQMVQENAKTFNKLWRSGRNHFFLPKAVETTRELGFRGYRLAIISNTTSSCETPQMIEENHLEDLFPCVILSSTFGRRKPHPSLFISAAKQLGVNPQNMAYVGNDATRDLVGARQANLGMVILISDNDQNTDDPDNDTQQNETTSMQPDAVISGLSQLLNIFPPQTKNIPDTWEEKPLFDVALSTMWHVDQSSTFNQAFKNAQRIGFTKFELNHKVSTSLFEQYDHNRFYISTVHEPCPAQMTYGARKEADIAISSLNEKNRIQAVDDIKRSIELAAKLGSRSVVIHPGTLFCEKSRDEHLRHLYQVGKAATPEFKLLREEIRADRKSRAGAHFEKVMKSIEDIISFSKSSGISLGLENRYRYYDIPLPDEMAALLTLCDEDWFGFQYDVGHAQALDALGQVPHLEWLERFASRMIGVHLHDVIGITDHQVPGEGEVNFSAIAHYLPDTIQRSLEINPRASLSDLSKGLIVLEKAGCIERISP
jgi:HAD superfamily hydrolase (TIGR01549 family)